MEIEAKFAVPDRPTWRRLAQLRELAGFRLVPRGVGQVADRYFDTRDGRLRRGGFACRLRAEGDRIVATLKGLGGAQGAVHRRAEEEVGLSAWDPDPATWPDSPARELALELAGGAPLEPLFDLTQRRIRKDLLAGERLVAQLSLDFVRVHLTALRRPAAAAYYELEIELTGDGQEADLAAVTAGLSDAWGLQPEPHSKFERALALLEARRAAVELNLTPAERRTLAAHAAAADSPHGRRACAILAWDEGRPTAEIVRQCGLSAGRVRYWVRAFRDRRLDIFPPAAATEPAAAAELTVSAAPPAKIETAGRPAPAPLAASRIRTARRLCEAYGVDLPHAQRVADHAARLFELLRPIHKLPGKRRRLLRDAALLNTIGEGPAAGGRSGRDLILAAPLRGLSMTGRLALACTVALSAGPARPEPEADPMWLALDEALRGQVQVMAALVRVAEALDASRTQSTEIVACEGADGPLCRITLRGPAADADARCAEQAANLWQQLVKQRLTFEALPAVEVAAAETAPPAGPPALPSPEPLAATDSMAGAGRKILALHFGRMLANEAGTRLGEDPEALHDMRVATRRMRAAFVLFAPYYDPKALKPLGKGLRRTGRTLGAVRDLDVLIARARAASERLAAEGRGDLMPLLEAWEADRAAARGRMLAYLDGPAYRRFVADFAAFLAAPPAAASPTASDQVRHVVPRLILERYEAVRAFERLLPAADLATYHALRIECKGLRYALEFFREVLGEETPALIKQVIAMQDLLGELQDARVAEALLTTFLDARKGAAADREGAAALAGVEAYLAEQRSRQAELLAGFPAPWAGLIGPEFRRRLALAIAAL